jgi:hypothetical protein
VRLAAVAVAVLLPVWALAYPLDGDKETGIRRLLGYRLASEGKLKNRMALPPGASLTSSDVKLRLMKASRDFDITPRTPNDPALQAGLERIFAGRDPTYNIAILDISDPARPRYAALRTDEKRIPGSVGKLMVATGIFGQLQRLYPSDAEARRRMLRETVVEADNFVYRDGKTVPFFKEGDAAVVNRRLERGDRFNLYEWLDHMMSQSSNAAASMVWKQAMLLERFGKSYPVDRVAVEEFFSKTPKGELRDVALKSLEDGLTASGLETGRLRIGTFFTSGGSSVVPGTASYASPNELLRWLLKMEQGKLVDEWSSLEMKKLLYFARPRYRYASSPALAKAAVYFKSGSLFQCAPEPGFECRQYRGNKLNLMHSVAVVESGDKAYLVALMSNVLKLNSAVEHQTIATEIERLVQGRK